MEEHYLAPGDIYFGCEPLLLGTLLGSCLAVSLWHPSRLCGGLCHIVLPNQQGKPPSFRYGNCVISFFLQCIGKLKTIPSDYHVGIFGGADMFKSQVGRAGTVGSRNIRAMSLMLADAGFQIRQRDVGGRQYRRIKMDMVTGKITVITGQLGKPVCEI